MTDTIYAWSQLTDTTNGASDGNIDFAEFQNPQTLNNSARALMARVAEVLSDLAPKRSTTGSGNAYSVTLDAPGATYRDGEIFTFRMHTSPTGTATLDVNGRGAKAFRPVPAVEFAAGDIVAGQPVVAWYDLALDTILCSNTGYHVRALSSGINLQAITAALPKIGDPVLSLDDSGPAAGRIRLTEATQSILKSSYPELDAWLSERSYPWGSTATHFSLPPAAGYLMRFAATGSTIDPDGPRTAGSTQADALKSHLHGSGTIAGSTSTEGEHTHTEQARTGNAFFGSGGLAGSSTGLSTLNTSSAGSHSHTVSITGDTASTGDTETRGKNVAFHVDIVASNAASAADTALFGFKYQWDTGTSAADPGTGRIRGNNATLASITNIYVSDTDGFGVDLTSYLSGLKLNDDLDLSQVTGPANRVLARMSGAPVDNGSYFTLPVTIQVAAGTLSNNDVTALQVVRSGVDGTDSTSVSTYYKANQLLDGEEGIALHFRSRSFAVNDYANVLTDGGRPEDIVAITRASTATYVDRDLLLKTASANTIRHHHDATTGQPMGLLVEGGRTNLCLRSEDFSTTWSNFNSSETTNAATAPDGTLTADKLIENTANNVHQIAQSISVTSGTTYTFSIFSLAAERSFIQFNHSPSSTIAAIFSLSDGAITDISDGIGGTTFAAKQFKDGWWRLSCTFTANGTGLSSFRVRLASDATTESYTGDGSSGAYLWGAMLEEGAHASSYIKTEGSTVARSADDVSISASGTFPIDIDNITVFVKGQQDGDAAFARYVDLNDGTTSNRYSLYRNAGTLQHNSTSGGSTDGVLVLGSSVADGDEVSIASAMTASDLRGDSSEGAAATDSSFTVPASLTQIKIGSQVGSGHMFGTISEVMVLTRAMTASELANLTG